MQIPPWARRIARNLLALPAAGALAIVLASCGSSNPGGGSTSTTGTNQDSEGTTSTAAADESPFGLGLSNSKLELSFAGSAFTSCSPAAEKDVSPTFSGGWKVTTDPGSTGKPVNTTLSPLPTSPFGDFLNGTISPAGVLTATGNGTYTFMSLALTLPKQASSGQLKAPVEVTGTAVVKTHLTKTTDCIQSYKAVTGKLTPP